MYNQHCVDLLPVLVEYHEIGELAVCGKLHDLLQGEAGALVVLCSGKDLLWAAARKLVF